MLMYDFVDIEHPKTLHSQLTVDFTTAEDSNLVEAGFTALPPVNQFIRHILLFSFLTESANSEKKNSWESEQQFEINPSCIFAYILIDLVAMWDVLIHFESIYNLSPLIRYTCVSILT